MAENRRLTTGAGLPFHRGRVNGWTRDPRRGNWKDARLYTRPIPIYVFGPNTCSAETLSVDIDTGWQSGTGDPWWRRAIARFPFSAGEERDDLRNWINGPETAIPGDVGGIWYLPTAGQIVNWHTRNYGSATRWFARFSLSLWFRLEDREPLIQLRIERMDRMTNKLSLDPDGDGFRMKRPNMDPDGNLIRVNLTRPEYNAWRFRCLAWLDVAPYKRPAGLEEIAYWPRLAVETGRRNHHSMTEAPADHV